MKKCAVKDDNDDVGVGSQQQLRIDIEKLRPVARLGYSQEYVVISKAL